MCNCDSLTCARLDSDEEVRRVRLKLNVIADLVARGAPSFWSDRDRGHILVTLQDRVGQVESVVESCRSCLGRVFATLFPLNPVPHGLADLMMRFRQGEAIEGFVREQVEAGARFAFALVLIHHPHLDLGDISRGPPAGFDWKNTNLDPFYAAANGPARNVVVLLERETAATLRQQRADL